MYSFLYEDKIVGTQTWILATNLWTSEEQANNFLLIKLNKSRSGIYIYFPRKLQAKLMHVLKVFFFS